MAPRFNDGFYFKTIKEWENEVVPSRTKSELFFWCVRLLPVVLLVGPVFAGKEWQLWLPILGLTYLFAMMFTFLDELNENIRFVRHQLWAFRDGVSRVNKQVSTYKDPERNFTLNDALMSLDREWENPG